MDYELEVFRLNNTCHLKKEYVCHICEEPGNLIQCEGPCNGTYHLSCLGLTVPPAGAFRCDECGSGINCFSPYDYCIEYIGYYVHNVNLSYIHHQYHFSAVVGQPSNLVFAKIPLQISLGRHTCFVCKESGNSTRRCSVAQCGRYYHEDCIQKFPLTRMEKNSLICPLHTCATCAAENPKGTKISKGSISQC
jgi:hypothetical protein